MSLCFVCIGRLGFLSYPEGTPGGKISSTSHSSLKIHLFCSNILSILVWFRLSLKTCSSSKMFESESERSVVSNSLWPHGLYSPWNSPGQNTGVCSLSLLQGIFPIQVSRIAGRFWASKHLVVGIICCKDVPLPPSRKVRQRKSAKTTRGVKLLMFIYNRPSASTVQNLQ